MQVKEATAVHSLLILQDPLKLCPHKTPPPLLTPSVSICSIQFQRGPCQLAAARQRRGPPPYQSPCKTRDSAEQITMMAMVE